MSVLIVNRIWIATGSQLDARNHPLLQDALAAHPLAEPLLRNLNEISSQQGSVVGLKNETQHTQQSFFHPLGDVFVGSVAPLENHVPMVYLLLMSIYAGKVVSYLSWVVWQHYELAQQQGICQVPGLLAISQVKAPPTNCPSFNEI